MIIPLISSLSSLYIYYKEGIEGEKVSPNLHNIQYILIVREDEKDWMSSYFNFTHLLYHDK